MSHLDLARLAAPAPSDEAHLRDCPRCRVEAKLLQRMQPEADDEARAGQAQVRSTIALAVRTSLSRRSERSMVDAWSLGVTPADVNTPCGVLFATF